MTAPNFKLVGRPYPTDLATEFPKFNTENFNDIAEAVDKYVSSNSGGQHVENYELDDLGLLKAKSPTDFSKLIGMKSIDDVDAFIQILNSHLKKSRLVLNRVGNTDVSITFERR